MASVTLSTLAKNKVKNNLANLFDKMNVKATTTGSLGELDMINGFTLGGTPVKGLADIIIEAVEDGQVPD